MKQFSIKQPKLTQKQTHELNEIIQKRKNSRSEVRWTQAILLVDQEVNMVAESRNDETERIQNGISCMNRSGR